MDSEVAALYQVFAGYPLREWTDPCPHCHTVEDERMLHRAPLRELTEDDLRQYVDDSLLLWGDAGDYKHFLPRIWEIATVEGGFDYPDVEVVYAHLAHAGINSWPEHERTAVRALALAHWQFGLAEGAGLVHFEPILAGIMLFDDHLSPYLEHWERSDDPTTLGNLAAYARELARIRRGERPQNAYLEDRDPALTGPVQVAAWLTDPALVTRLAARPRTAALDEVLSALQASWFV